MQQPAAKPKLSLNLALGRTGAMLKDDDEKKEDFTPWTPRRKKFQDHEHALLAGEVCR